MIKASDYIAQLLVDLGVRDVFMLTGGGAMHLNDSFSHHPKLSVTYFHHEQACAIAAEGYYRSSGKVACVCVTTGPGSLNTLTGILGQWTDSIPAIYIAGQVNMDTTIQFTNNPGLRQLGDQEVDIIPIVSPIVKYATALDNPRLIKSRIEKAFHIATTERKGPVFVLVPMNIQGKMVSIEDQKVYTPSKIGYRYECNNLKKAKQILESAKAPLIVAGHGIRLDGSIEAFQNYIHSHNVPVVTTFNGIDIVPELEKTFIGRIGTVGTRAANIVLQNADVILFLGTRNNVRQISYNGKNFAPQAYKIVIDMDKAELNKSTIKYDLKLQMPIHQFLAMDWKDGNWSNWMAWCKKIEKKYPIRPTKSDGLSLYTFFSIITDCFLSDTIAVAANGSACVGLFQAGNVKDNSRFFWNSGCASMGYDLPAAIGACIGVKKTVYCFAGDGSIQLNLQELQTIVHYKLPIKILYLNNGGYSSIQQTQNAFFGRRNGCDDGKEISFPSIQRIANAYGIPYFSAKSEGEVSNTIYDMEYLAGPCICEVFLKPGEGFEPKVASTKQEDGSIQPGRFENMYPLLSDAEVAENIFQGAIDD